MRSMFKCYRRAPFNQAVGQLDANGSIQPKIVHFLRQPHLFNAMAHHLRYSYLLFKHHFFASNSNEFDSLSIDCHCKRLNKMPRHQFACTKYCRRCQLTNHSLRTMQTFPLSRLMIKQPALTHRPFHPHRWNDSVSRMILRSFSKSKNIAMIFWWVKNSVNGVFFGFIYIYSNRHGVSHKESSIKIFASLCVFLVKWSLSLSIGET